MSDIEDKDQYTLLFNNDLISVKNLGDSIVIMMKIISNLLLIPGFTILEQDMKLKVSQIIQ